MAKYITNGNIAIGYEDIPARKKPCICVRQGNESVILGTFKNENDAEFFIKKLVELTNAKEC